jgi:hypothetical protein
MEAPAGSLEVGDRFSSTGDNGNGIFHDSSVVVEAEPGERFGFDTDSTLDRKHGEAFHSTFTHRYTIEPNGDGSTLSYVGEVRPQNYVPWWLRRGFRVMSRLYVERLMPKHLTNLSNLAASRGAVQVPESA